MIIIMNLSRAMKTNRRGWKLPLQESKLRFAFANFSQMMNGEKKKH